MYYKKYESERLYLSPMCAEDYKTYAKWLNDESLGSGLGNFKMNLNEENEKEWITENNKKGDPNFAVIIKDGDILLGNYGLELKDDVSRRYHVGGFIGEASNRGKGYGTEALALITKYAFEILNAETVYSGIFSFNVASIGAALKVGYTKAGIFRNAYYYNGKFNDEICVEITKEDYLQMKENIKSN